MAFLFYSQHQDTLFKTFKNELYNAISGSSDLVFVCRDSTRVVTQKRVLQMFSKFVRTLAQVSPVKDDESLVVILPDVDPEAINSLLKLLTLDWEENKRWGQQVKSVTEQLGIEFSFESIFEIQNYIPDENDEENMQKVHPDKNPSMQDKNVVNETNHNPPGKLDFKINFQASCPMCKRKFSADRLKLKDELRFHIGYVHYETEMVQEIKAHMTKNTCNTCDRTFKTGQQMRRHLILNHTKYVKPIKDKANEAITMARAKLNCVPNDKPIESSREFVNAKSSIVSAHNTSTTLEQGSNEKSNRVVPLQSKIEKLLSSQNIVMKKVTSNNNDSPANNSIEVSKSINNIDMLNKETRIKKLHKQQLGYDQFE